MKLSLDHIHIQSSDPDATKAFLAKMFDATDEWVIDFGAVVITRMHLAGSHINIFHRAPTTAGPMVRLGTKWPSITSMWM